MMRHVRTIRKRSAVTAQLRPRAAPAWTDKGRPSFLPISIQCRYPDSSVPAHAEKSIGFLKPEFRLPLKTDKVLAETFGVPTMKVVVERV
jgi:hypothetical protein